MDGSHSPLRRRVATDAPAVVSTTCAPPTCPSPIRASPTCVPPTPAPARPTRRARAARRLRRVASARLLVVASLGSAAGLAACESHPIDRPLGRGEIVYEPTRIVVEGGELRHQPVYHLEGVNVDGPHTYVIQSYWTQQLFAARHPRFVFDEFELVYRTLLTHRGVEEANQALDSFRTWTRRQAWWMPPEDEDEAPAWTRVGELAPPESAADRTATLEDLFLEYWAKGQ